MRYSWLVFVASVFMLSISAHEASAQSAPKVTSVEVPPGAKVQINGKTALISGGQGIGGTYTCTCGGGSGSCTLSNTPHGITCSQFPNDTCKGACELITSTGGATGGAAAKSTGTRAPTMAPARQ
jgi:hypothetical protein